ncbi:MAG: hypothetical protein ACLSHC_05185 [Bilophila wadsworthia]
MVGLNFRSRPMGRHRGFPQTVNNIVLFSKHGARLDAMNKEQEALWNRRSKPSR